MDSMDNFRERFEALEQQMKVMGANTRTVERRLRWWRGIACGAIVLALLGFPLQSGKAQYEDKDLAQRVKDLEYKLQYVTGGVDEVVITGANLRIVNGLGSTNCTDAQSNPIPNCPNGLGNLIVGYNELRGLVTEDIRTGSHNVVVGRQLNYGSFGGLVVGEQNDILGTFASVSGGTGNKALGGYSSVSGGGVNTASGDYSSVSGGGGNTASGFESSISGGNVNTASNIVSSVSGGENNTASGYASSVCGGGGGGSGTEGQPNTASGDFSTVTGGTGNIANGHFSSVSGGEHNRASGEASSVSGGANRTAPGTDNWAAGQFRAND